MEPSYWHVSSTENRASIAAYGLDHARGDSPWHGIDFPAGNYLFGDQDAAHDYAAMLDDHEREEYGPDAIEHDVWHVTWTGPVTPDPFKNDQTGMSASAVYATTPIPAAALTLAS